MARITRALLLDLRGEPLIAEFADEEAVPYRRSLAGFQMRGTYEPLDWRRNVGPPDESDEEDPEGIELEVEEEDEEEDEP